MKQLKGLVAPYAEDILQRIPDLLTIQSLVSSFSEPFVIGPTEYILDNDFRDGHPVVFTFCKSIQYFDRRQPFVLSRMILNL